MAGYSMESSQVVVNAYILYAFMGVIVLLLVAVLGVMFRALFVLGGLKAEIEALWRVIGEIRQDISDLREQVVQLRERVAENRGLLLELHRRIDQLTRHRHDPDTGSVVITPAPPEREPVAD